MLHQFGKDIWISDGANINAFAGFHYPTRMAIIRLSNGDLLVWSPIELTKELQKEIDALGILAHLVAPNSLHHVYLTDWINAYPHALCHAAPKLQQKRADIQFHTELGDVPDKAWSADIDQVVLLGNRITTEVVFFHKVSNTVIFADMLQQLPPNWYSGWRKWVAKLDLMSEPLPAVPRKFRMAFNDKSLAKAAIKQVLNWPVKAVLMAHGTPVVVDGSTYLRRAFNWLLK